MIGFRTKVPKMGFRTFDRKMIKRNFKRINNNPLARAAAIVMRTARGSIKRRGGGKNRVSGWKRKPSPPGTPPRSWGRGSSPPFKMIRFAPSNKLGTSYDVGMVGFGGASSPVPELMEHGGSAPRTFVERKEATFKHQSSRKKHGKYAQKIKARGKRVHRVVKYQKRPFMFPALIKVRSKLPDLWRNSIRHSTIKT